MSSASSIRCNPRRLATVPHFRLVECATRRIMEQKESEAGGTPLYAALSYVWGQRPPGQSQQQQQQQHRLGGEGGGIVEAIIEDAIRVALELGYGYLGVDRYCIVQTGNESIKQEQLRHMHTVYANADVTLVAAASTDASVGLLGAPGRPHGGGLTRRGISHASASTSRSTRRRMSAVICSAAKRCACRRPWNSAYPGVSHTLWSPFGCISPTDSLGWTLTATARVSLTS